MSHRPRKRFGQNFLHDQNVIRRIIEAIDPRPEDHLVEVGPGQGAITLTPTLSLKGEGVIGQAPRGDFGIFEIRG